MTVYDVPDFRIQDQKVESGLLNIMQLFLKENKIANNLTEIDKMLAQMDSLINYTINNTYFKYRELLLKVGVYDVHNMLWYAYSTYSQGPNLYMLFQIWIDLLNLNLSIFQHLDQVHEVLVPTLPGKLMMLRLIQAVVQDARPYSYGRQEKDNLLLCYEAIIAMLNESDFDKLRSVPSYGSHWKCFHITIYGCITEWW